MRAYQEFSDIADYIWKAPRLLDHEREVELDKLPEFYPKDPETAEERWRRESRKLDSIFPYLIATGNLFSVTSLFEAYLILLAQDLEKSTGVSISSARGQGASRIFNYLKLIGIKFSSVELYHQMDAALQIRNCLVHASGILSWSRYENELRRIQKSGVFLSPDHRSRRNANKGEINEVQIVESHLGDRIQITNKYSWLACWYFRDYFMGLCIESPKNEEKI